MSIHGQSKKKVQSLPSSAIPVSHSGSGLSPDVVFPRAVRRVNYYCTVTVTVTGSEISDSANANLGAKARAMGNGQSQRAPLPSYA